MARVLLSAQGNCVAPHQPAQRRPPPPGRGGGGTRGPPYTLWTTATRPGLLWVFGDGETRREIGCEQTSLTTPNTHVPGCDCLPELWATTDLLLPDTTAAPRYNRGPSMQSRPLDAIATPRYNRCARRQITVHYFTHPVPPTLRVRCTHGGLNSQTISCSDGCGSRLRTP